MAYAAAPLAGEKDTYKDIWQLRDKNLSRSWLPTLDANGSIIYNSSVVDMTDVLGSLPVPGIADLIQPLPHEQYKVTLDINQMIYDGGAIRSTRALEQADFNINEKQTETDLYKLRGQLNSLYFNLLLLDRQRELLQNYLVLIKKRISSMNSALAGGVILKSDMDVLLSERIKLEQQLCENETRKASVLKILSDLTDSTIDDSTEFVIPGAGANLTDELTRPELLIFDLRKEQLNASRQLIQSKRMPKAFGFATLGYGNPPGSNFFKDEFAPYYIIGAGVRWNIFDWNKTKNEKQVVTLHQSIIESRETDMMDNLKRLLDAKSSEISSIEALLKTDTELIELRKRITSAAESQYENGTITVTDYLIELNSEKQAIINYEMHKINLVLARVEYLNISGKEIE
jgi:outer membrane protein TolC